MDVAIVKYNAGNIFSVVNALRRLGIEPEITDDAEKLQKVDRVLFPGQGHAKTTMDYLRDHHLDKIIQDLRQPVLGICVGMQLLCSHSEEGDTDCIGVFPAEVKKFKPQHQEDKVPAMGWNSLYDIDDVLFKGIDNGDFSYFIHSFYVPTCEYTIAKTSYILPYSAAMHKDNFWATQFHPEKSGKIGEQILTDFLNIY